MAVNTELLMKRRILKGGLQTISPQQFDDIRGIFLDAQTQYQVIAQEAVDESFAGVPATDITTIVDNTTNKSISEAKLFNRYGIYSTRLGGAQEVRAAYEAAIEFLRANAPMRTGYYKRSADTSDFFTVRRVVTGGKVLLGEITEADWDTFGPQSSIEIYSRARYAAPLEVLRGEACLGAAYNAISSMKGVNVRFQYKNPDKYGQIKMFRKSDGKEFQPLVVPVLTIGSIRNTALGRGKDGKPPKVAQVARNILHNRNPGGSKNLLNRGIYKGPLRPR